MLKGGTMVMTEEVTIAQVLQAVTELSEDLTATESRLNDKFNNVESRLDKKIDNVEKKVNENGEKLDKVDTKFSIVRDEIFNTKTDVQMLQDAK